MNKKRIKEYQKEIDRLKKIDWNISIKVNQEFKDRKIKNKKILVPRASNARKILIEGLNKLNNDVRELCIYKSVLPSTRLQNQIKEKIIANDVYGVTFTSSSTVENFFKFLDPKIVKKEN